MRNATEGVPYTHNPASRNPKTLSADKLLGQRFVVSRVGGRQPFGQDRPMFFFFSNRLGCLGSIVVSILATVLLVLLLRGCQ
jgi:hypothetical protein